MTVNDYAPVCLFVYNRPRHTSETLKHLLRNELADQSDLIVFSDGPRRDEDKPAVAEVRALVSSLDGFHSVSLIERENNLGLADSITSGVSEVCERYGRVIVLEDDLETSPAFLQFMNAALDFYQDNAAVWHISGWNYPMEDLDIPGAFFTRMMNCWGWATWADRWRNFEKNPEKLIQEMGRQEIHRFNMENRCKLWPFVLANQSGKLNTWAIFWYSTIFTDQGLCLNPKNSFVRNIGMDNTGMHCTSPMPQSIELSRNADIGFPVEITENERALNAIGNYYRYLRLKGVLRRVKSLFN
jgi:hypothetical protein